MKKIITVLLFIVSTSFVQAQFNNFFFKEKSVLGGGAGITWIDDKPFYSIRLFPELALGNFGIGLDLKLEYGTNGQIRTENFNEFSDYLSVIRYLRYGTKNDPFYIRLGALDYATLGHGSIMYLYNNSPSYDSRKAGVEVEVKYDYWGFGVVYGNFGEAGVMGIRGYFKPFKLNESSLPFISELEVGASVVTDVNKYAGVLSGSYNKNTNTFSPGKDEGSISVIGLDLGLPVVRSEMFGLELYLDYAKIINFGSGVAAGLMADFSGLGLVDIKAKLERRWNGDNYIPSYFNALYEIERFQLDKSTEIVNSKVQQLRDADNIGNGYYGELLVRVLGTLDILGSYQRLDDHPDSGILHLYTDVLPDNSLLVARAGYDKINIRDESDLFTLDDRSYLYAELGYKPMQYIVVSMVYQWTFTPVRDANDNVVDYRPQKKIEPRISFVYPLNM